MDKQMKAVMVRRGELLARIAVQRRHVAELGAHWQAPLAVADRGMVVIRYLRTHPVLLTGLAALMVSRRRGVLGVVSGAWLLVQRYRLIAPLSKKIFSHYRAYFS